MAHEEQLRRVAKIAKICCSFFVVCIVAGLIGFLIYIGAVLASRNPVPSVGLASMSFTVLNITETRLSAKWDFSIRIPGTLPYCCICLQGDFQACFLYKNVTLATSSLQKYNNLYYHEPQILTVSTVVSGKDISGLIGKNIMEDIKEKKEVKFVSRFSLTDCRKKTTTGTMSYACSEATLRFEPGSEMKATVFGKHPSCINI